MKDTDYICMLAPMKSKLKLKGNAVILFALIHGYSKDGKTTCRASLQTMAEWIDSDKSAVSKIINKLEETGYINKMPYYVGGVKCYEYTTNYESLLARYNAENPMCLVGTSEQGGCQNDNGCLNDNKGLSKRQRGVVKMTTNNIDIIYNNIFFSSRTREEQEQEKKSFYNQFFFRNAADPAAEVERFIAFNDAHGWANTDGKPYDTPEKRLGLSRLWEFKTEGHWARPEYVKAVKAIYDEAIKENIEGVEVLIDQRVNLEWDGKENKWSWKATAEARKWVTKNSQLVHQYFDPIFKSFTVKWVMVA